MLPHFFYLAPFLAIALGAQQVPLAGPPTSPFTADFDKLIAENLDRWHTPGLAIAVIEGEDTFSKVWTSPHTY